MDIESLREKVIDIVVDQLGVARERVVDDASFTGALGADSLDLVEMVMEFENNFNIEIPDQDQEKIVTVADAVNYLYEKVNAK